MANLPAINAIIVLAVVTIHTSVHHKLTKDNYRLWKSTIVPILKGHSMYEFVNGTLLIHLQLSQHLMQMLKSSPTIHISWPRACKIN
jgi:sensor domain CHASE-containing protein